MGGVEGVQWACATTVPCRGAQALMGRGDLELLQPGAKLLVLGLGLLFLGRQDFADATLEVRSAPRARI